MRTWIVASLHCSTDDWGLCAPRVLMIWALRACAQGLCSWGTDNRVQTARVLTSCVPRDRWLLDCWIVALLRWAWERAGNAGLSLRSAGPVSLGCWPVRWIVASLRWAWEPGVLAWDTRLSLRSAEVLTIGVRTACVSGVLMIAPGLCAWDTDDWELTACVPGVLTPCVLRDSRLINS